MKDTGAAFELSSRQAGNFAADGLGAISQIHPRVANALTDLAGRSKLLASGLQLVGQAAVIVGGVLAVASIVEAAEHYARFGETVTQLTERLEKEAEAERKFAQERRAAVTLLAGIETQRAQARAEAAAAALRAAGDEVAAEQAAVEGRLAALEGERAQRERQIIETVAAGERRNQLLAASEQLHLERRRATIEAFHATVEKINDQAAQKEADAFIKATDRIVADLERRVRARQEIETRGVAAAQRTPGADIVGQIQRIDELKRDQEALANSFALLRDRGVPVRDLFGEMVRAQEGLAERVRTLRQEFAQSPAALEHLQQVANSIEFGGLFAMVDAARSRMSQLRIDAFSLDADLAVIGMRLGDDLPRGIDRAAPAMEALIQRFQRLRGEVLATLGALQALDVELVD